MQWERSTMLALARQACAYCFGLGYRHEWSSLRPCHCVERHIFRICYARLRELDAADKPMSRVSFAAIETNWSMKGAEYSADFLLCAKHTLGESSASYRLFRQHFLLRVPWRDCCRRLGLNRGEFWHEVYRIEQRVGLALAEAKLFPLDGYFTGGSRARAAA